MNNGVEQRRRSAQFTWYVLLSTAPSDLTA
jgi:hypothetical protein